MLLRDGLLAERVSLYINDHVLPIFDIRNYDAGGNRFNLAPRAHTRTHTS